MRVLFALDNDHLLRSLFLDCDGLACPEFRDHLEVEFLASVSQDVYDEIMISTKANGIRLHKATARLEQVYPEDPFYVRSAHAFEEAVEGQYDLIVTTDRDALGFHIVQAKHTGILAQPIIVLAEPEQQKPDYSDVDWALPEVKKAWCKQYIQTHIAADGISSLKEAELQTQFVELAKNVLAVSPSTPSRPEIAPLDFKKVSICIAHYNYGQYVGDLLQSIDHYIRKGVEVILVDDGSRDESSRQAIVEIESRYAGTTLRVFYKENGGIGNTRNFAARQATGDFIIFMDADNLAFPNMIETLWQGLQSANADCVACHFHAFDSIYRGAETGVVFRYAPLGACLVAGTLENVFGDANFMIRKDAYWEVGGFKEDRTTSWEDYDFLARLVIKGKSFDVVPMPLFWYRHHASGFSKVTNQKRNHMRVLRGFAEALPPLGQEIVTDLLMPYFYLAGKLAGNLAEVEKKAIRYRRFIETQLQSSFDPLGKLLAIGQRKYKIADHAIGFIDSSSKVDERFFRSGWCVGYVTAGAEVVKLPIDVVLIMSDGSIVPAESGLLRSDIANAWGSAQQSSGFFVDGVEGDSKLAAVVALFSDDVCAVIPPWFQFEPDAVKVAGQSVPLQKTLPVVRMRIYEHDENVLAVSGPSSWNGQLPVALFLRQGDEVIQFDTKTSDGAYPCTVMNGATWIRFHLAHKRFASALQTCEAYIAYSGGELVQAFKFE